MSSGITRDEWLSALHEIGMPEDDPSAVTIMEFADLLGVNRATAERRLRALEKAGRATRTHKRASTSADGRMCWFVAYRLLPKDA